MSNTFDDENLEEIDKEKVYQGRFDEKLVKKLGYDDFDDYRNYESFFCDVDEIEELEYRLKNENYFCLIEDDIEVLDDNWISNFIEIYNKKELNCGLLAIIPHTNSFIKKINLKAPYSIEQHKHPDGIQFISTDKVKQIGYYDESFKGDCDTDDYCFNLLFNGYFNYKINIPHKHYQVSFDNKILKKEDDIEFSKNVRRSRILLKEKWNLQLGWRRSNTGIYDGWKKINGKWQIDKLKTNLHPPGYIEGLIKENLI